MSKTLKAIITGEGMVYRNDKWGYPIYSLKLCTQTRDGLWDYDYIQVRFPTGHELPNGTEIKINDAFLSFFPKKDGSREKYIRIKSYDILNQTAGEIDIPVTDDSFDLPF